MTRIHKLSDWRALVDSLVTSTYCVAQVSKRTKSVRLHRRMSILRLFIARGEQLSTCSGDDDAVGSETMELSRGQEEQHVARAARGDPPRSWQAWIPRWPSTWQAPSMLQNIMSDQEVHGWITCGWHLPFCCDCRVLNPVPTCCGVARRNLKFIGLPSEHSSRRSGRVYRCVH